MHIIEGSNVDLIEPFPSKEVRRILGWLRCYKTIADTDDFPHTAEEFEARFLNAQSAMRSWGIIDKNNALIVKHEAPLVGVILFEQTGPLNGNFHVATSRKAWGSRFVDEAGELVISRIFSEIPDLSRVSASIMETNAPAKALARRLGFVMEGVMADCVKHQGILRNITMFGLTRTRWDGRNVPLDLPSDTPVGVAEAA